MIAITLLLSLILWGMFYWSFSRDRSRYRNCHLLFWSLVSLIPLALALSGDHARGMMRAILITTVVVLLMVPFFLIHNGILMIKREGRSTAHLLSLALGIVVLIGEVLAIYNAVGYSFVFGLEAAHMFTHTNQFLVTSAIVLTVVYGSVSFVIFMIYSLFLMIIPRQRDFDYVIIHGAGLLDGDRMSKLLRDRVDKAIQVYRKDPTPPKLIPSGGKGPDETISEAEAMKRYLLEQGIPESDIITEDRSMTTFENLRNSKEIIDGFEGRKYTALVTSNYHVYRALRYCRKTGLKCKGIGSHVAFYFWPSALIREFIAVHSEKKHALIFIGGWIFWMWVLITYVKAV